MDGDLYVGVESKIDKRLYFNYIEINGIKKLVQAYIPFAHIIGVSMYLKD